MFVEFFPSSPWPRREGLFLSSGHLGLGHLLLLHALSRWGSYSQNFHIENEEYLFEEMVDHPLETYAFYQSCRRKHEIIWFNSEIWLVWQMCIKQFSKKHVVHSYHHFTVWLSRFQFPPYSAYSMEVFTQQICMNRSWLKIFRSFNHYMDMLRERRTFILSKFSWRRLVTKNVDFRISESLSKWPQHSGFQYTPWN